MQTGCGKSSPHRSWRNPAGGDDRSTGPRPAPRVRTVRRWAVSGSRRRIAGIARSKRPLAADGNRGRSEGRRVGKSGYVRVDLGGGRLLKKKKTHKTRPRHE